MKDTLEKLKHMTKQELDEITKQTSLSASDLEKMSKAVCLIEGIERLEETEDYKHSYGTPHVSGRYSMDHGDMSYERGRSRTTGRYISRDGGPYSYDYDRGYSSHSISDRMVAALERMYDEADSPHEEQVITTWINRIRSGN